jgi:hypothetical protein
MSNINCPKYLQGYTVRVTQLDECGEPEFGDCAFATSDGYIQATLTPNVEEPDEFKQKNAHGIYLTNQRSRPLLNWVDVSVQFRKVDFELFSMITGAPKILNDAAPTPQVIGTGLAESTFATGNVAIELWMGNDEEECGEDALPWYGYNLLPWVVEGAVTEVSPIANGMINFTVASRTRKGTPWGVGPYDVVLPALGGDAVPLFAAVPSDAHWWGPIQTQVAPPEESCGCQFLSSS